MMTETAPAEMKMNGSTEDKRMATDPMDIDKTVEALPEMTNSTALKTDENARERIIDNTMEIEAGSEEKKKNHGVTLERVEDTVRLLLDGDSNLKKELLEGSLTFRTVKEMLAKRLDVEERVIKKYKTEIVSLMLKMSATEGATNEKKKIAGVKTKKKVGTKKPKGVIKKKGPRPLTEIERRLIQMPTEWTERFGEVVWAKQMGYPPWPALIQDPHDVAPQIQKQALNKVNKQYLIVFYNTNPSEYFGFASKDNITDWETGIERGLHLNVAAFKTKKYVKSFPKAVEDAKKEFELDKAERGLFLFPDGIRPKRDQRPSPDDNEAVEEDDEHASMAEKEEEDDDDAMDDEEDDDAMDNEEDDDAMDDDDEYKSSKKPAKKKSGTDEKKNSSRLRKVPKEKKSQDESATSPVQKKAKKASASASSAAPKKKAEEKSAEDAEARRKKIEAAKASGAPVWKAIAKDTEQSVDIVSIPDLVFDLQNFLKHEDGAKARATIGKLDNRIDELLRDLDRLKIVADVLKTAGKSSDQHLAQLSKSFRTKLRKLHEYRKNGEAAPTEEGASSTAKSSKPDAPETKSFAPPPAAVTNKPQHISKLSGSKPQIRPPQPPAKPKSNDPLANALGFD